MTRQILQAVLPLLKLLRCLFELNHAHLKHLKPLSMLFLPSTASILHTGRLTRRDSSASILANELLLLEPTLTLNSGESGWGSLHMQQFSLLLSETARL